METAIAMPRANAFRPATQQADAKRYLRISVERKGPLAEQIGSFRYYSFNISLQTGKPTIGATDWNGGKVVIAKKLPRYLSGMAMLRNSDQELGSIEYSNLRNQTACAYYYYPKLELDNGPQENLRGAEGFGYYVEILITNWLKKSGIQRVYTPGNDTSESREGQLKKVGLPVGWEVEIADWISKLAKGVRIKIEKYELRIGRREAA